MRALRILRRSIRDSFKSVFRNFSLSVASIACTTITLILVAISLVLTYNVRQVTTDLEHELTIVVYLNKDVTEEQKVRISNDLETMENVDSYVLKSKDEWKAEMKEEDESLENALDIFEENPLLDSIIVTVDDVKKMLGSDYEKSSKEVLIATQICHLLAQNTDGNPRKIKRFVNMLLLRYEIAKNRGFGDELELAILAKMMLAEYYAPDFYKALPNHLDSEGKWDEVPEILNDIRTMSEGEEKNDTEEKERWYDWNWICKWLGTDPEIVDKDLRPYYYACKEKIDYFSGQTFRNDLSEIVDLLFRDEMIIVSRVEDLKNLTNQESDQVFGAVTQKIMEKGQFDTKPKGVDGLIILVQNRPELRKKLIEFIDNIPEDKVGVWVVHGWDKAIPKDCDERKKLDQYFDKLKSKGSIVVKEALKMIRGS